MQLDHKFNVVAKYDTLYNFFSTVSLNFLCTAGELAFEKNVYSQEAGNESVTAISCLNLSFSIVLGGIMSFVIK